MHDGARGDHGAAEPQFEISDLRFQNDIQKRLRRKHITIWFSRVMLRSFPL